MLSPSADREHSIVSSTSTDDHDIVDDTTWTTGDFEIISSDNVRLRVPSYHLFSASGLFRNAHSLDGGARSVTMLDERIETADVLRLFLELVAHGRFLAPLPFPDYNHVKYLKRLVDFLVKWGCEQAEVAFWHTFERAMRDSLLPPQTIFMLAAACDQARLVGLVLEIYAARRWTAPLEDQNAWEVGTEGKSMWCPHHWPGRYWAVVPPKYLYAVSRAYATTKDMADGLRNLVVMFEHWLGVWDTGSALN